MRSDSNQGPDSIASFLVASCYNLKLSIGGDRIIVSYRNGVDYLDNILVKFTNLVLRLIYTKYKQKQKRKKMKNGEKYQIKSDNYQNGSLCFHFRAV